MHSNAINPLDLTLAELARAVAAGEVSSQGLLGGCLARIAHDNGKLGAIRCLFSDIEMQALRLDLQRNAGEHRPLLGIPIILKDNIDVAGQATTCGNTAMGNAIAARDAGQTRRLREAGAVIIGKANLSEFSFEVRSRSSLGGDVLNPFNPTVTAGGSSGGTAAAVAAGFALAGLGTDTGGSIRVPASLNGLVGLRPTHGWLDGRGTAPLAPSTDTIGPIGRCVQDVAWLLQVMSCTAPATLQANTLPNLDSLRGVRLGVLRQAFGTDPQIVSAMQRALALMVDAGAELVDPLELPSEVIPVGRRPIVDWEFVEAFNAYLSGNFVLGTAPASLAHIHSSGQYLPEYTADLGRRLDMSRSGQAYQSILDYHAQLKRTLSSLFRQHGLDGLLYPTCAVIPTSLDNPAVGWAPELAACSGWPALTQPVGQSASAVPIGLEILGPARSEPTLLGLAYHLERLLRNSGALQGLRLQAPDEGPGPKTHTTHEHR